MNDDIKNLWQNQKTEEISMSAAEIRMKAEAHWIQTRWWLRIGCLVIAGVVVFNGWEVLNATSPIIKLLAGLQIVAVLVIGWWIYRNRPSRAPAANSPAATILDYYRKELERLRQLGNFRKLLTLASAVIGPILLVVLGVTFANATHGPNFDWTNFLAQFGPLALFVALWVAGLWFFVRRRSRKLQRKIDELGG